MNVEKEKYIHGIGEAAKTQGRTEAKKSNPPGSRKAGKLLLLDGSLSYRIHPVLLE
ncbi:hypothetical protein [Paenibacillus jiagnxiensis]|uniref:hypothetical protein n=1 Tax=Paenibacillus jiagnxiensis TaxID=3228926 RepID=UPI0033A8DB8F